MKKIGVICFLSFTLFALLFCASQNREAYNLIPDSAVSSQNAIIKKEQVKTKAVIVTDDTGTKRKLTMKNIDIEDKGLYFRSASFVSDYSQVFDGHYYYVRCKNGNEYTIYQDKGKKVGKFELEDYEPYGILRSGKNFYLLIEIRELEGEKKLAYADLQNEKAVIIGDISDDLVSENNFLVFYAIYQGNLYYSPEAFKMTGETLVKSELNEVGFQIPVITTPAMDKANPRLTFLDGNIYYAEQHGKNITLYEYDLHTAEEREIFCYQRNNDREMNRIFLEIDNDYIYCQDYLIPRRGGKMKQVFKDAKVFDHGEISFAYNRDYLYYIDKLYRLRRIDKKSGKDIIINKKLCKKVDCTEDTVYAIACDPPYSDEIMDDVIEGNISFGYFSNDLYCMDLNGNNVQQLWKGGIEGEE